MMRHWMSLLLCLMTLAGCTGGDVVSSSLGLSIAPPQIKQKGSATSFVKVNSATEETEFQVPCDGDSRSVQISYDKKSWVTLAASACFEDLIDIRYAVPTSQTINGQLITWPRIPAWLKTLSDRGESEIFSLTFVKGTEKALAQTVSVESYSGYVNSRDVVLDLSSKFTFDASDVTADYDAYEVYVTSTAGCTSGGTWRGFAAQLAYHLPSANSSNDLYVKFRDVVGNESSCQSTSVVHDDIAPQLQTFSIVTAGGGVRTSTYDISSSALGDYFEMSISPNGFCTSLTWEPVNLVKTGNTVPFMNSGNTISLRLRDRAHNLSNCLSASFNHDDIVPSTPTLSLLSSPSPSSNPNPVFRVQGLTIGDSYGLYTDSGCSSSVLSGVASSTDTFYSPTLAVEVTFSLWGGFTDPFGNTTGCIGPLISYTLDTTPPTIQLAQTNTSALPSGNTSQVIFDIQVTLPADASVYRWKAGLAINIDCSATAGYSSWTSAASNIHLDLSSQADGGMRLCVQAKDAAANLATASSSWNQDTGNPNFPNLTAWTPTAATTTVLSTGNQTFSVTAIGAALTYQWYLDDVLIAGRSSASENFTAANFGVSGDHVVKVRITNGLGNSIEKSFAIRRNTAPILSAFSPTLTGVSGLHLNVNSSQQFSVTASDADGDALTYVWTLDNVSSAKITNPINAWTAQFSPNGDVTLLGEHTLKLVVSDGYESALQSWSVSINYFTDDCNLLLNSSVAVGGGKICTLIGNPSMGHGLNVLEDQTRAKFKPQSIVELESNVYAISDSLSHVVFVYNANPTGLAKFYFGQSIEPGMLKVVLGNGGAGRNDELVSWTGTMASGLPQVKLFYPMGLAYDGSRNMLYVADATNNRVLALNSSGQAIRILGLSVGSSVQNSTTNQSGALGNTQVCYYPMGLALDTQYLYVSCTAQHAIKKVDLNTGVASIVVGRLSPSSATIVSPISGVSPDGQAGFLSNTAVAYAHMPGGIGLSHDGLLFWSEPTVSGQGNRIRVVNLSGTMKTLYAAPSSALVSAANFLFQGFDHTGNSLTTTAVASSSIIDAPTSSATALGIQGPGIMGQNVCHAIHVSLLNGTTLVTALANVSLTLSFTVGSGSFYTGPDCATLASGPLLPAGSSQKTFWVKSASAGSYNISVAATGLTTATTGAFSVVALSNTASTIRVNGPPKFRYDECVPVEFTLVNGTTPAILAAGRTVIPTTNNFGSYFSDAACSAQIDRLIFTSSESTKVAYYSRRVSIPAGWTASLAGYNNMTSSSIGGANGQLTFATWTTSYLNGLEVKSNSMTGSAEGVYFSVPTSNLSGGVYYLNLTQTDPGLSVAIGGYSTQRIVGTGSSGYNGEERPGHQTKLYFSTGTALSLDGTKLLIGDFFNYRGRSYDINASGTLHTLVGAGRDRYRLNVLVPESYLSPLVNPMKLQVVGGELFFLEGGNSRIRKVSLSTGVISQVAGSGSGTAFTEGNDALYENMYSPNSMQIVDYPNSSAPTNKILFYTETCQVRAVNIQGSAISNIFGVGNLGPGKVKTIAGDSSNATCATWTPNNTDGMDGTLARMATPIDVAYTNNELYIAQYADHCILKLAADGSLTRVQGVGSCFATAPGTNQDGLLGSMATRYPRAFTLDPRVPGNFFFSDRYQDNPSAIRYFNLGGGSSFWAGTVSVPAGTVANPQVKTILSSGTGMGIGQIAYWLNPTPGAGDQVCWVQASESQVSCAVTNSAALPSRIAGSPMGVMKSGAPLDREQEGISALNATLNSPAGLAFDDDGNLYISDSSNHLIRMVRRWW